MSDFKSIFESYNAIDKTILPGYLLAKFDTMNAASKEYPEIKLIIKDFMFGTIFADGVLDGNELKVVVEMCRKYRGDFSIENIKDGVEKNRDLDPMQNIEAFKKLPEFLRDELVMISLIIADIDGSIDEKELEFLKKVAF